MGAHRVALPTVGIALTVVAALMVFVQLPNALRWFDHAAAAQVGRNAYGGATAAADSVEIDDGFVQAALTMIPRNGRFTVVLPADTVAAAVKNGMSPVTFQAPPAMMEDFLLPRREVEAQDVQRVLVVALNTRHKHAVLPHDRARLAVTR